MKKHALIILLLFILSNCTPARIAKVDIIDPKIEVEKVYVSRKKTIMHWGVQTVFGYDDSDKIKLNNGKTAQIYVPVGNREFFIRTNQADKPNKIYVELKENQPVCFKVYPSVSAIMKSAFIFPLLFWFTSAFEIEREESCPPSI
jgi:hypothetical protein